MRYSIFIVALAVLLSSNAVAQTVGKAFTKSFHAEGIHKIKFELPGAVDLKVWNHPTLRIEIYVSLPSGNESMVEQLAKVGRYDLKSEVSENAMVISAPNAQRVVKVKGQELRETLSYVVFMPKNVEAEIVNTSSDATGAVAVQKKP